MECTAPFSPIHGVHSIEFLSCTDQDFLLEDGGSLAERDFLCWAWSMVLGNNDALLGGLIVSKRPASTTATSGSTLVSRGAYQKIFPTGFTRTFAKQFTNTCMHAETISKEKSEQNRPNRSIETPKETTSPSGGMILRGGRALF